MSSASSNSSSGGIVTDQITATEGESLVHVVAPAMLTSEGLLAHLLRAIAGECTAALSDTHYARHGMKGHLAKGWPGRSPDPMIAWVHAALLEWRSVKRRQKHTKATIEVPGVLLDIAPCGSMGWQIPNLFYTLRTFGPTIEEVASGTVAVIQ